MKEKKKATKDNKPARKKNKKSPASNQKIENDFLHQLNETVVKPEIKITGMEAYHPLRKSSKQKIQGLYF
jgi:hypothetical protein